jgi:hypothetical protein
VVHRPHEPADDRQLEDERLAMNRMRRLRGRAAYPMNVKSRKPMWLPATTPAPLAGMCSTPRTSNR